MSKKKISGTREWAKSEINCVDGCEHGCRYCYARAMALRFHRIETEADWTTMTVRQEVVDRNRTKRKGRVMFPTSHDITPAVLTPCLTLLDKLLQAGNDLLIVSKPHLSCITEICDRFSDFRSQILFRFTIGAMDDRILSFWEPGAPPFAERFDALKCAFKAGYATSVSVEPMLDSPHVVAMFHKLAPFVTDCIWIGKMNKIKARVDVDSPEMEAEIERIEAGQTDECIEAIYRTLKDDPKVKWKESVKSVVGLPLATEAGTDE
jgi:DNA repair photolyase